MKTNKDSVLKYGKKAVKSRKREVFIKAILLLCRITERAKAFILSCMITT